MVAHAGLPMGHAPAAYGFPPPAQGLYMAPPMPATGRRTTGTPKERAQSGRWTHEEHLLFLQGLELHGKEWKKISKMIKTRSLVQIRSHAQKYFQKLVQAREHGLIAAEDTDSQLLMDGKRMATGCGQKSKSKKKGKDAVKRRAPIVRLSGPCANVFIPMPSPAAGSPTVSVKQHGLMRPDHPGPMYQLYDAAPQPQLHTQQAHQSLHGGPLVASAATFYCDAATLSDSGCTSDGDGGSSACSSTTASGASTPSLQASLSFDQTAAIYPPCHAGAEGYSTSSSATTSASPSEGGDNAEDYQDLSLAAYDDDGVEIGADAAQLETFFTPDELEQFMTGMLAADDGQGQQQQGQGQQQEGLGLRRPALCGTLNTAALFVPEQQQQQQQPRVRAVSSSKPMQAPAEAFALPHTPSYSEAVGHAQQGGCSFPSVEPRVEVYHQAPQVIYSTQQLLYQQQQGQSYGNEAAVPVPAPAQQQPQGGWMLGPL